MATDLASLPQRPFEGTLRFGRFSLDPGRKLLLADGQPVRVGGRALDLLIALVERAGEVVSHEDLFARVWPRSVVEESSLRVHLSALRKALGEGGNLRYIASVPGRGYSFVMDIEEAPLAENAEIAEALVCAPGMTAMSTAMRALPSRLTGLIGREPVLAALSAKLQQHRLVTLVGPGGIGKTVTALALADDIARRHGHGVAFVDLASLDEPALVPVALAAAIGISVPVRDPWPPLEAMLVQSELLIVVDNCEHVISAAAALAEHVLRAAPRVRILATSREPLEAESEMLHRLEALTLPPDDSGLAIAESLAFSAVRLFVDRATANSDDFAPTQATLPAIVRLCRHLDGVPLAIELAAARVGSLGIQALAERLDDVFQLARRGRRTMLPRHQTLQALLDWSHDLLDDDERTVLHRLSRFRSAFTLDIAMDLASCERIARSTVVACVLSLVSKSLLELEGDDIPRYRLLYVTRLHAEARLEKSGEPREYARRHAACFRDMLAQVTSDLNADRMSVSAWMAQRASIVPDVRAALDWTEGPEGDKLLGVELIVESTRLAIELGLNDEFLQRALNAHAAIRPESSLSEALELRFLCLLCTLSGGCQMDRDVTPETTGRLEVLALRTDSPTQQRTALQALCIHSFGRGNYPKVAALAERLRAVTGSPADSVDPEGALIGHRFGALAAHYLGDHRNGWDGAMQVLEHSQPAHRNKHIPHVPAQVAMGAQRARILWMRGQADSALECAREALAATAVKGTNPFGLGNALALALIPILLWRGDDDDAKAALDRLVANALRHFHSFWLAWGSSYCRVLALRGHDVDAIQRRIGAASLGMPSAKEGDMLGTLVADLVGPEQLDRVEAGTVGWCAPEILRVHGDRLLSAPASRAEGEAVLLRALTLAREQGALAWELRAATSLATLWQSTRRGEAAGELLAGVLGGFTEGLECVDVRRARALLSAWRAVS